MVYCGWRAIFVSQSVVHAMESVETWNRVVRATFEATGFCPSAYRVLDGDRPPKAGDRVFLAPCNPHTGIPWRKTPKWTAYLVESVEETPDGSVVYVISEDLSFERKPAKKRKKSGWWDNVIRAAFGEALGSFDVLRVRYKRKPPVRGECVYVAPCNPRTARPWRREPAWEPRWVQEIRYGPEGTLYVLSRERVAVQPFRPAWLPNVHELPLAHVS